MSVETCDVTANIRPEGRKASAIQRSKRPGVVGLVGGAGCSAAASIAGPPVTASRSLFAPFALPTDDRAAVAPACAGSRAGSSMQAPVSRMKKPKPTDQARSCAFTVRNGSMRNG